jgi:uncharacterized alpha-E superfamily protein
MIFDPNNPRALLYQMDRLQKNLSNLPKTNDSQAQPIHEILILKAYELIGGADKEKLAVLDTRLGQYLKLDDFLANMYDLLSAIQNAVSKTYFTHVQSQKQLFSTDQSQSQSQGS